MVDDEQIALTSVKRLLRRRDLRKVEICDNGSEAIKWIKEQDFDIVLLDLLMPEIDGIQVLEATKAYKPHTEFIILTAVDDVATSVKAIRLGAYDYLVKPVDNKRLLLTIQRAYERKCLVAGKAGTYSERGKKEISKAFDPIITQEPRMKEILFYTQIMARGGNPVLITGETGTGKELLAKGIHYCGPFSDGPFIPVNVSSIPESLFESHFFGHIKGSFTSASQNHIGYFEQANNGTLFLDEIGELPLNLQVKLLRVLDDSKITRIGEIKPRHVNVQIVSASNSDLNKACQNGTFRLDLFYRLNSTHIYIPPLRERKADIPLIVQFYLRKAAKLFNKNIQGFSPDAMELLTRLDFPGNVRELIQIVENAVLLAETNMILPIHLGINSFSLPQKLSFNRKLCGLRENEEIHIAYVFSYTEGDKKQVADILGISVRQVQRKVARMKKNPHWKSSFYGI